LPEAYRTWNQRQVHPQRRYDETVKTRGRIEMSRTGAPMTVPAARGDLAPRISGPAAALHGALGGIYGAAAMSILPLAARRARVLDKMVPQVESRRASGRGR